MNSTAAAVAILSLATLVIIGIGAVVRFGRWMVRHSRWWNE